MGSGDDELEVPVGWYGCIQIIVVQIFQMDEELLGLCFPLHFKRVFSVYTLEHPLSPDVLLCYLLEVPVADWVAH